MAGVRPWREQARGGRSRRLLWRDLGAGPGRRGPCALSAPASSPPTGQPRRQAQRAELALSTQRVLNAPVGPGTAGLLARGTCVSPPLAQATGRASEAHMQEKPVYPEALTGSELGVQGHAHVSGSWPPGKPSSKYWLRRGRGTLSSPRATGRCCHSVELCRLIFKEEMVQPVLGNHGPRSEAAVWVVRGTAEPGGRPPA